MLKIVNPEDIVGKQYNQTFDIIGVRELTHCYEFTLGYASIPPQDVQIILLHRKKRSDGMYLMEYNNKFLELNINEFDSIDKIIICMHTI
jgi:hypothetical protein